MVTIRNVIVKDDSGRRWKVREAISWRAVQECVDHCRVSGSIGARDVLNKTYMGGGITVLADVVQVNSDGSERQAYTMGY